MRRIGRGSQVMVRSGASSCRDDQPLAGFEELAMPLFDSLYNFSRWLAQNSNDAEDLVQETSRTRGESALSVSEYSARRAR